MIETTRDDPRRRIPPVDQILAEAPFARLEEYYGRRAVSVQLGEALDELRQHLAAGGPAAGDGRAASSEELVERSIAALPAEVGRRLEERYGRPLARVVNATGIFLHTNLGRAPLPREVAAELPTLLDAYCDLEMDLATGRRSDRNRRAAPLLAELTGAADAAVVNNNAGAVVLALAALAGGREVIVSRGELVEIGGSFRLPEMMAAAGARLVEVGTTNRVCLGDYAAAIGPETALLLKVFPSNYRIEGFTATVAPAALAALGHERGIPLVVDEGSGLLRPHRAPQLADHRSVAELVEAGCGLVTSSGDKLLGGPQAGLLVGTRELVERCRKHPLYRPLRPSRAAYALLEAVLRWHLAGRSLPIERLWPDRRAHRRRLEALVAALPASACASVVPAAALLGGGSAPERPIPGEAVGLALGGDGERVVARLRQGEPPVVGYLREGRLVLDLRTVAPEDDGALVEALRRALAPGPANPADGAEVRGP